MRVLVLSQSKSFEAYLHKNIAADNELFILASLDEIGVDSMVEINVALLHMASLSTPIDSVLAHLGCLSKCAVAVASDLPKLEEMLYLNGLGINAYCNSYMADIHYHQLLQFLDCGQSWYIPGLLTSALQLAQGTLAANIEERDLLHELTRREKKIAQEVSKGLNNKSIAKSCGITERTVKAHLTKIFSKSGFSDRVSLALYINSKIIFRRRTN